MKKNITFLLIIFAFLDSFGQTILSYSALAGDSIVEPIDIEINNAGQSCLYGRFVGNIKNVVPEVSTELSNFDLLLIKYDNSLQINWLNHIRSKEAILPGDLTIDNNDNLYISGSFRDTTYFNETTFLTNTGNTDGFLAKYSSSGDLIWAKNVAKGSTLQRIFGIDIDKNQEIISTGLYVDSCIFSNDTLISSNPYRNSYLAKYDLNGNLLWTKNIITSNSNVNVSNVNAYEEGLYFSGYFKDSVHFDLQTIVSSNGTLDMFILKTDFNGNEEWIRRSYGGSNDFSGTITRDDYGNIYYTGYQQSVELRTDSTSSVISNQKLINNGVLDFFIIKYNKSGTLQWMKNYGGTKADWARDIEEKFGFLYVTGYFTDQLIFKNDTLITDNSNDQDLFVASFDLNGTELFAYQVDGHGGGKEFGTAIDIDQSINAYITGYSESDSITISNTTIDFSSDGYRNTFTFVLTPEFSAGISNITNLDCYQANNGQITTTPYFGVPPYTYAWSHDAGLNDSVAANLSAGAYTVTITDSRDSTAIGSATVEQPQPILVDFDITNTTCYNGNDGALDITVTGGNNEYDYTWDGGVGLEPKEEDQTGLYAGTYYLTVTDQKNCTKLDTVEISQPGKIRFNPSITPSGEGLSNGAIDLNPEGGNPPYNFAWSGPSSFTETTEDVTGLAGGTYNVTITHDASCSADTSIFVPEENQFQIYISNVEHISCYGASDGSASVSVENETGLLAYTWYDSTKVNIVSEFAAASNLDSGKYYVRVEDQFPHVAWDSVVIQQPDSLYFSRFFRSQVQCNGENTGYIDVEIDGGTPVYTYQWAHGPTSENLTGLAASDEYYKVTVTDANGCTSADSGKILEPDPVLVTIDKQDPLCPGTLSGIATANASGGVQPYDYVWNDPGNQTEKQATALPAGNFTVTVTDFAGCIKTASTTLNDPAPIQITSVDVTHINCHGSDNGSVSVDVTGGTGSYEYTWNHSSENSGTVNSLAPGDYSVIVTDANNCTPDTAFATITEPDTVIIDITTTQIDCHGQEEGEILINASGGSGSFTYEWEHTTSGFSELGGLAAGTYDVTVSDGQCPPFEYSLEISEPEALSVDIDTANATCHGDNDGAITISVTGGTGSYSYSWSHTATDTNRFTNLLAGNYSVTVSDGACPLLSYENIPVTQPDSFYIASIDSSHVSEFGARDGFIQVNMSGGIPPLRFSLNGGTVRETNAFNDLGPGMYTVVINDANQCGPVSTGPIEIKEPPSAISGVWKSNEISIFPNPARNTVYLRFQGLQEDIIQVRIVNILGELIFDSTYRDVLQNNVLEINTEEFSTGTYFMIINNKRAPHPLIID